MFALCSVKIATVLPAAAELRSDVIQTRMTKANKTTINKNIDSRYKHSNNKDINTKRNNATKRKRLQRLRNKGITVNKSQLQVRYCLAQMLQRTKTEGKIKYCRQKVSTVTGRCCHHRRKTTEMCEQNDKIYPNPYLVVKKSQIPFAKNGVNVKTKVCFQEGDYITEFFGNISNKLPKDCSYTYKLNKQKFVIGIKKQQRGKGFGTFVNRGTKDSKNCELIKERGTDKVFVRATKFIGNYFSESELYCSYGIGYIIKINK